MAKMTIKAGDDYMLKLSLVSDASAKIAKKAIRVGAGILTSEIRKNLTANLNDPESASRNKTVLFKNYYNKTSGSLLKALGFTKVKRDRNGVLNSKIGFGDPDYDPKGVPNLLKATVMEHGSSTIRKRPFVRPAVNAKKKEIEDAMNRVIDEEIEKIMKG